MTPTAERKWMMFRGYEIEHRDDGWCVIGHNKQVIHTADTDKAAMSWVDDKRERELVAARRRR